MQRETRIDIIRKIILPSLWSTSGEDDEVEGRHAASALSSFSMAPSVDSGGQPRNKEGEHFKTLLNVTVKTAHPAFRLTKTINVYALPPLIKSKKFQNNLRVRSGLVQCSFPLW